MTETTLADRVSDRAAATETGVAVEKAGKTIFDLIRDQQQGFAKALPATITPERFLRVAITTVRTNPTLARCEPMSLLGALTLSAQLGLEPGGPLGHAYLVPFGREVTFIVGYRGLMALARRSGDIADIYAENVYDGDVFSWSLGLHRDITHEPTAADRDNPDNITHVYAVAKYRDGSDPSFVVLTRAQVESFRARSKAKNRGPWVTDWAAMACKTAIRRLSTWLPLSTEVARALSADEQTITRIDVNADDFIDVEEAADDDEPAGPDVAVSVDAQQRRAEAVTLYKNVLKRDEVAWKEFAAASEIPTDSRQWTDEQVEHVIEWCNSDPEEAAQ